MERILNFQKNLATILGLLIMILTFIIVVDGGGRFLFNKPLPGGVELSRIVLAWILYLSLTWGLLQGVHVRVTLFLERYPHGVRVAAEVMIALLTMGFFCLMVYASSIQFWKSFKMGETMPAPIWIPFWLGKLAVPIGCLMIVVHLPIDLISRLQALKARETSTLVAGRNET